jgi:hypothetical protein
MSNIDDYAYQAAHQQLRPGEVIFSTGWMMRGTGFATERFIAAVTSQRMLVIAVKGGMTGGPTTNETNRYWIEFSTVTKYDTGATLIELAQARYIDFTFNNGHQEAFSIPKMGRGLDGQPDFFRLVPFWLQAHMQRGSFYDPNAAGQLAQECSDLQQLRSTYAPKHAAKEAQKAARASQPRTVKWPIVLAILALGAGALGFKLAGDKAGQKDIYASAAASSEAEIATLEKIPADKLTKKQKDELDRARYSAKDSRRRAKKMAGMKTQAQVVGGLGIAFGIGFIALAIILTRRRKAAHGEPESTAQQQPATHPGSHQMGS